MQVKPFKYSYYLHIPTKNKRGKEKKGNAKNENLTKKAGGLVVIGLKGRAGKRSKRTKSSAVIHSALTLRCQQIAKR